MSSEDIYAKSGNRIKYSNIRLQICLLNLANPNQGLWIFDQTQTELYKVKYLKCRSLDMMAYDKRRPNSDTVEYDTNVKLTDWMPAVEPLMSTALALDQIQWVVNKNSYYPFSEATGSDVVEFWACRTAMEGFLMSEPDSFWHSVSVNLSDSDVHSIK